MQAKLGLETGSYYANPNRSDPHNLWPDDVDCPEYEQAFMTLANFMTQVGLALGKILDRFGNFDLLNCSTAINY